MQLLTDEEILAEMTELRNNKKRLKSEIDEIDSQYIGYREELRRRKELAAKK